MERSTVLRVLASPQNNPQKPQIKIKITLDVLVNAPSVSQHFDCK